MTPLSHEIALAAHRARVQSPRPFEDMPHEWRAECEAIADEVLRAVRYVDRRKAFPAGAAPDDDAMALEVVGIARAMLAADPSIPVAPFFDDHLGNALFLLREERKRADGLARTLERYLRLADAVRRMTAGDASYQGSAIVIECGSHDAALRLMREVRSELGNLGETRT